MPGAEELVRWCNTQKLPMALVTSSTSESVAYKSAPHEWLKLIKTRVQGDDESLKAGKPSPDPFLLAAKKIGANPQSCWALEDSESGKQSALKAGCQVWILNNNNPIKTNQKDSSLNPRYINILSEFLNALKQFNNN